MMNGRNATPVPQFPSLPIPNFGPMPNSQPSPGDTFRATGKTVVITGGSQGVGRATALVFARKGYNVVVAARDATRLGYVTNDCAAVAGRQGASLGVVCDVTSEEQVRAMVSTVLAKYENIDVVVNNAGVMTRGPFLDVPVSEARRLMEVNYIGAYNVTQAFAPLLAKEAQRKAGGTLFPDRPSVIMVNAFNAKVPMKYMSAFTASKYALMGFTEAIRSELEPLGIHVGSVHPGVVKSNHLERTTFYGKDVQEERKAFRATVKAMPISQTPQEVADAIYNAAVTKSNDVVVGAPFAAVDMAHRLTGLNPMALPIPFL